MRHISFLTILLITVFVSCENKGKSETTTTTKQEATGDLKNIALANLEGEAISLTDYRDKIVFLNFWATWCKPCIAEMPSIQRAMERLKGKDVVFLAASDESVEKIEKFKAKNNFDFDFIRMMDDYSLLKVYALPTTIIYHRNGEIVLQESGARNWDDKEVIDMLSAL